MADAERPRRAPRAIDQLPFSTAQISVGVLAVSIIMSLVFSLIVEVESAVVKGMVWGIVAMVSTIAGPTITASTLAGDRGSGLFALELQKRGGDAPRTALAYLLGGQRLFWLMPLLSAPALLWSSSRQLGRGALLAPLGVLAITAVFTIIAGAIAAQTKSAESPGPTAVLAMIVNLVLFSIAAPLLGVAYEQAPARAAVGGALVAIITASFARGIVRKFRDNDAPFFSEEQAVATQLAVSATIAALVFARPHIDARSQFPAATPIVLSFAFAVLASTLARPSQGTGAQNLLRWRLDRARRSLDTRDPRRSIVFGLGLSAIASMPAWVALDAQTLGAAVLGLFVVAYTSCISTVFRTTRDRWSRAGAFAPALLLFVWPAAQALAPDSVFARAWPLALASNEALGVSVALPTVATLLVLAAAIYGTQRTFARAAQAFAAK